MNNLDTSSKIKNFKLSFLQHRYRYLTDVVVKLEKHLDNLFVNGYIELVLKNQMLGNLFILSKNLNTAYNSYIMDKLESKTSLDSKIAEFISLFQSKITDSFLFEKLLPIIKDNPEDIPLNDQENEIKNIIAEVGYDSLLSLIEIFNEKKICALGFDSHSSV